MTKWYVQKNGKQHGPFEPSQLKQLAQSSKIGPDDLVWRDDMQDWIKANKVNGLFPAVAPVPPAVPRTPPPAPTAPPKPPAIILASLAPPAPTPTIPPSPSTSQSLLTAPLFANSTENPKPTKNLNPTVTPKPTENRPVSWVYSTRIVLLMIVWFFPIGLLLVWTHPLWKRSTKAIWMGCFGAVFMAIIHSALSTENGDTAGARRLPTSTSVKAESATASLSLANGRPTIVEFKEYISKKNTEYISKKSQLTFPNKGTDVSGTAFEFLNDTIGEHCRIYIGGRDRFGQHVSVVVVESVKDERLAALLIETPLDLHSDIWAGNNLESINDFIRCVLPDADCKRMISERSTALAIGGNVTERFGEATLGLIYNNDSKVLRAYVTIKDVKAGQSIGSAPKEAMQSDTSAPKSSSPQSSSETNERQKREVPSNATLATASKPDKATTLPKPLFVLTFDTDPGVTVDNHGAKSVGGKVGKSLQFDSKGYVKMAGEFPSGDSPRTLAAWLKDTRIPAERHVHIIGYGSNAKTKVFGIMEAGGKWRFYDNGGGLDTGVKVDTDWHHHCVTYDGKEVTYFLDGKQVSKVERTLATSAKPLVLGTDTSLNPGNGYEGLIDELVIYDKALAADQVGKLIELGQQGKHPDR